MTLPKIDNNGLTNALWRSRIDGGIDQINTNTTAIATNASNIATNASNIATNGSRITSNDTDIATNASNIATNASNIASNDTDIATNASNIATNTSNISTNTSNISTNTSNISTNTSNISTNTSNISTNTTNIASNLTKINADILQHSTQLAVTQSGNESTTQVVVSGHTSATFDSSNSGTTAAGIINTAINSIPKNMGGHNIDIIIGTTDGQEITVSSEIFLQNFEGGVVTVKSAKTADNDDDGSTKANKIVSAGTSIDRIISINKCSECNIQGLELKENTGTVVGSYVVVVSTSWSDINHCKLTGGGTGDAQRAVLSQRGANVWLRDSWVDNVATGILINNSAIAAQSGCSWTGTQPITGMYAAKGIGITSSGTIIQGSVNEYIAANGGLITNEQGIILEETVLTGSRTVNLDSSMSVTEIQNLINDQPKQLNTYTLTFQFADGEYDFLSGGITFHGFDGGYLIVQGNTSDTLAADGTGLSVKLKGDQGSNSGLAIFLNCSARCHIKNIAFEQDSTSVTDQRLLRFYSVAHGLVDDCSFNSLSTTRANEGIVLLDGRTRINNSKFNNLGRAIYSIQNNTHSHNNAEFSGGTAPNNGLVSIEGSIITQQGTQINGHTNDTVKSSGGVIFNSNGTLA